MTPEMLMCLTQARGTELPQERLQGSNFRVTQRTATGRNDRTTRHWNWALDTALACGEIAEVEFLAFRYRWARDELAYPLLKRQLFDATIEMKHRERWPTFVAGRKYLKRLVSMALLEEHAWWWIRTAKLWPDLMEVGPVIWEKRMSRPYEAIRFELERWCTAAHEGIRARLA